MSCSKLKALVLLEDYGAHFASTRTSAGELLPHML